MKSVVEKLKEELINGLLDNHIVLPYNATIHLAIVNEPFLTYIKEGQKTIESRFTKNKIAPFCQIQENDIVCMKAAGSPVDSFFIAGHTKFFLNDRTTLVTIKENYEKALCAFNESFWETRSEKKYITLIDIKTVKTLNNPFNIQKKDKRAWIRFANHNMNDIILVAGKIGSGKTFWANTIAQHLNCSRASFSDYIKYICKKQSIEINRTNLQKIGADIIENDMDGLINFVLQKRNSDCIVIDGLRHIKIYKRLKELCPSSNITIVYVDCDEKQRQYNLLLRGEDTTIADKDITEMEQSEIKKISHLILNYSSDPKAELKRLAPFLSRYSIFDI